MTNQSFCYWLQGFFEISREANLTREKVIAIDDKLKKIVEPLGEFTQWLGKLTTYFSSQEYRQELLNFFLPEISDRLNLIFYHVIDNSYDSSVSIQESKRFHDGIV